MKIEWQEQGGKEEAVISIVKGEHLTIKTPKGNITIYIGESDYNCITSWVHDVEFDGFYTNNATKRTSKCNEEVQHIRLAPKGDA